MSEVSTVVSETKAEVSKVEDEVKTEAVSTYAKVKAFIQKYQSLISAPAGAVVWHFISKLF